LATVRKNQGRLSKAEWERFIDAIDAVMKKGAAKPNYADFLKVHVQAFQHQNHDWGVHTMPGMLGRNFLVWHRQYLLEFERRLQREDSDVFIPYWNWPTDSKVPSALKRKSLLKRWKVSRNFQGEWMPGRDDLNAAMRRNRFGPFQRRLESAHGDVHVAVGGEMGTARSPADPVFWLHHANVDRIWARWQAKNPGGRPKNTDERLKPAPLLDAEVGDLLKVADLGYRYT
jgi:tyrosinase